MKQNKLNGSSSTSSTNNQRKNNIEFTDGNFGAYGNVEKTVVSKLTTPFE